MDSMDSMGSNVKRLYRTDRDARLAGVCGGLGDYLGVDPVVIRLLWIVMTCFTGFVPGIVAYLVAWFVVPVEPTAEVAVQPAATPDNTPA